MTSDFKLSNIFSNSRILNNLTGQANAASSSDYSIQGILNTASEDGLQEVNESEINSDNQGLVQFVSKVQELQTLKNEKLALIQEQTKLKKEKEQLTYDLINAQDDEEKSSITQKINELNKGIESVESAICECDYKINSINTEIAKSILGINSNTNNNDSTISNSAPTTNNSTTETIDSSLADALDKKLGTGFAAKVEEVAKNLNCNPNDLLAMMYSESGLDPSIKGACGAVGLIQFMPSLLTEYGYTADQVAAMSGVQQLDLVQEFLSESKRISGYSTNDKIDAGTLYAICFLPASAKNEVLCSSTGNLSWAYNANSPLDIDNDGAITKSDMATRLNKKYNEMVEALS